MEEFNVEQFLSESQEAVELDTIRIPIPDGEYVGQIGTEPGSVDLSHGVGKNGKPWLRLNLKITIPDANLKAQLKRAPTDPDPVVYYGFFIDLNEQGKTDWRPQRNINLAKVRAAVGQNKAGAWNFMMLAGQQIKLVIKQKKGEDGEMRSEVVTVMKPL